MYIRALSPAEQAGIEAGLHSSNAFSLRRSQILLASSRGQRPCQIAHNLGCATQTVRNTLHAFEQRGLASLKQESSRPKTIHAEFDQAKCEADRAILHQSPRTYGKQTSVWTLALAAQVPRNAQRAGESRRNGLVRQREEAMLSVGQKPASLH
jgi:transposase